MEALEVADVFLLDPGLQSINVNRFIAPIDAEEPKVPVEEPQENAAGPYVVVHKKVAVRSQPSTSASIVGIKYAGDTVIAEREQNGWILLAPESSPRGNLARGSSFWMLVDGAKVNLGLLLRKVNVKKVSVKPRVFCSFGALA